MFKGCIVRLYPNKEQIIFFENSFNCTRFLYNKLIEINNKKYSRTGRGLSAISMSYYIVKLKKQYRFLDQASHQALGSVCYNLTNAFKAFFKKQNAFPAFKKKKDLPSFSSKLRLKIEKNKLKIPKIGFVNFRGGAIPEGKLKCVTVKKIAGKYYASLLIDDGKIAPELKIFDSLTGIDLGLKSFAVVSNGELISSPNNYQKAQKKLRRKQKSLSRKIIGSKKREQAKIEVARLHQKVQNQRKDFHHKITKSLVANDESQAFAIEDLNIKGMVRNRKLAKHISDAGWSQFKTFLKYKSADVGKQVFEVDRFFASSKTCSSCGVVNGDLKLADREWTCSSCKTEHDRDFNASLNIALEAARNVAGGDAIRLEVLHSNILSGVGEADNLTIEFRKIRRV